MEHIFHDIQYYQNHTPKHKMTTLKQYSLLKRKMAALHQNRQNCFKNNNTNGVLRYKQDSKYWTELTAELNNIGPPYRTMQQWKKVWCDFKRGQKKRSANKSTTKTQQCTKKELNYDNEISEGEIHIKAEPKDYEETSSSIYTTFSNKYDNDYSYPDEDSFQESCADEKESFMPDESSCSSYTYPRRSVPGRVDDQRTPNKHFLSPPPLQPSNLLTLEQSVSTLQNQMDHQTKLLEHLSQISNTIVNLMERQADAVEKQTEVIRRRALATEHHTSVMNTFIDMIREKMLKNNSQKQTISTESSKNDIL